MYRFSINAIAVSLTGLAITVSQAQIHDPPTWVVAVCAQSPCTLPAEVFAGVAVGQTAYEKGTSQICPPPDANQRMGAACITPDPDFITWVALTRMDLTKVIFEAGTPLRGPARPAEPFYIGVPGDDEWPGFADGNVFGVGLPVDSTEAQNPPIVLPPGDAQAWFDFFVDICGQDPSPCPGAAMTQPEFDTMLAASSFATARHSVTFTQPDGSEVTVLSGPPQ